MTQFHVTFCPSSVNAWLYRIFTIPFVRIDSVVQQCSWGSTTSMDVPPGEHFVETYVRYKHGNHDLALGEGTFNAPAVGSVCIRAANTWANQSVFMPHVVAS